MVLLRTVVRWGFLATLAASPTFGCGDVDIAVFEEARVTGGLSGDGGTPVSGLGGSGGALLGGLGGGGEGASLLLDDFEDGNLKAIEPAGWWYGVSDGTGTQTVAVVAGTSAPERSESDSSFVLEVTSAGATEWGSALGVDVAPFEFDGALELSFSVAASRPVEVSLHALDTPGTHFTNDFSAGTSWSTVRIRLDRLFVGEGATVRRIDVGTLDELQWFLFDGEPTTLWFDDVVLTSL